MCETDVKIDVVDCIIRWESGEMDDEETVVFFQHLIDTGIGLQLQGCYQRTAQALIDAGLCKPTWARSV